jgi:hypothetical protein
MCTECPTIDFLYKHHGVFERFFYRYFELVSMTEGKILHPLVYESFIKYCEKGKLPPVSSNRLGRRLAKTAGVTWERATGNHRAWYGIKFRTKPLEGPLEKPEDFKALERWKSFRLPPQDLDDSADLPRSSSKGQPWLLLKKSYDDSKIFETFIKRKLLCGEDRQANRQDIWAAFDKFVFSDEFKLPTCSIRTLRRELGALVNPVLTAGPDGRKCPLQQVDGQWVGISLKVSS